MTHQSLKGFAIALLAALTVSACSSVPPGEKTATLRARYEAYAGAPVDQFTWLGRYYSWTYLGRVGEHYELAIWITPFDAYLLTVNRPCEGLPFVEGIRFSSTAHTISRRVDFLLVHNTQGNLPWKCYIQDIRPVDVRRLEQDAKTPAPAPAPSGAGTTT